MRNYIIMSLHNRVELTKKTIEHLFDFSGEYFDLWLVNDGSEDSTEEYINSLKPYKFCKSITIKSYKTSEGKAKRLNEFLKLKSYDFCAVVDNDVILPLDWLSKSIKVLQNNPNFGMCGVNVEGLTGGVVLSNINHLEVFNAQNIGGACLVWGDFVRDNITIFSEDYGRYGHEDAHITRQVRVNNKLVVCLKDFGIHLGDARFDKNQSNPQWSKLYTERKKKDFDLSLSKLQENIKLGLIK